MNKLTQGRIKTCFLKISTLFISAIILLVVESEANLSMAAVVEGSFTGVVDTTFISYDGSNALTYGVVTPVGVQVGDHVTGYFRYDTALTSDLYPNDPSSAFYEYNPAGSNSFWIESNGLRWSSGNTLGIEVENNYPQGDYQSVFVIQFSDAGSSFPGNQLLGQGAVTLEIANVFTGTPSTLLKSDNLPTSLSDIDLSAANITEVFVASDFPGFSPGRYGFYAHIDPNSFKLAQVTAPSFTATPSVLWPPNHKLVPVTVTVSQMGLSSCQINSVSSNELITTSDWQITGDLNVELRAERSGKGNGERVYTINIDCMSTSGIPVTGNVIVTVPHNQSKKNAKGDYKEDLSSEDEPKRSVDHHNYKSRNLTREWR